jgi:allantoin racemase
MPVCGSRQVKQWPDQAPECLPGVWNGGSSRHRPPVLREGRKNENIYARNGFIWGILVNLIVSGQLASQNHQHNWAISKMKKRILIINPNTAKATAEQMEQQCRAIASSDTSVDATYLQARPGMSAYKVFSYVDLAACTMPSIKIAWQNRERYDGIIVAGFSDVGVDAMKEMLTIPVLGIAESSYHLAALLGHRFAVLIGTTKWMPPKHDYVKALGVDGKAVSFRAYSEWDETDNFETVRKRLIKVSREAIKEDGAEVVILGGGPLVGFGKSIEKELGVPVIDPTLATFKLMESLIDLGLSHSKIRRWSPPLDALGDETGIIPYDRGWLDEP